MLIDSPTPYSPVAAGLMKKLGVDPGALDKRCTDHGFYSSLGMSSGVFFDRETFGGDRLLKAPRGIDEERTEQKGAATGWQEFLLQAPLTDTARRDILRIETQRTDYMPGLFPPRRKTCCRG